MRTAVVVGTLLGDGELDHPVLVWVLLIMAVLDIGLKARVETGELFVGVADGGRRGDAVGVVTGSLFVVRLTQQRG